MKWYTKKVEPPVVQNKASKINPTLDKVDKCSQLPPFEIAELYPFRTC